MLTVYHGIDKCKNKMYESSNTKDRKQEIKVYCISFSSVHTVVYYNTKEDYDKLKMHIVNKRATTEEK